MVSDGGQLSMLGLKAIIVILCFGLLTALSLTACSASPTATFSIHDAESTIMTSTPTTPINMLQLEDKLVVTMIIIADTESEGIRDELREEPHLLHGLTRSNDGMAKYPNDTSFGYYGLTLGYTADARRIWEALNPGDQSDADDEYRSLARERRELIMAVAARVSSHFNGEVPQQQTIIALCGLIAKGSKVNGSVLEWLMSTSYPDLYAKFATGSGRFETKDDVRLKHFIATAEAYDVAI